MVTKVRICAECRAGYDDNSDEGVGPAEATVKVSHPHPDHPNLRVTKWVCDDHWTMLCDDHGEKAVRLIETLDPPGEPSRPADQPGDNVLLSILRGE